MKKRIAITKLNPLKCQFCPAVAEFTLQYWDWENPKLRQNGHSLPNIRKACCKECLQLATNTLYKEVES